MCLTLFYAHLPDCKLNTPWLGWVSYFGILWVLQTSHCTSVTGAPSMGTNDVLKSLNHPLLSLPVLGRTKSMSVYDAFSQDAFYFSSIKVDQNLALEFSRPKFP